MRLLIKQRVFSWTDSYDIYNENGEPVYFVRADFFSIGHRLRIYDCRTQEEIGLIQERVLTLLHTFDITVKGNYTGCIRRKWSLFHPAYEVEYNGWQVSGDFWAWNYEVYSGNVPVVHIHKELFHWGDTYVIDIAQPENELMGLILVIAIDAANCSK